MRKYSGLHLLLSSFLLLCISGCTLPWNKKTNWNIDLNRKSKNPYGSYLAFESLRLFFPNAKINPLSSGFRYSSINESMIQGPEGKSLFLAVGLDFYLTQTELNHLIKFAENGNELFIFARAIDAKLEQYIRYSIRKNGLEEVPLSGYNNGKANLRALYLKNEPEKYGYQGRSLLAFFTPAEQDTIEVQKPFKNQNPEILGFAKDQPNMLRFSIGKGHLTLHAGPLAMSNYFLLQNENHLYLQKLWKTLPDGISRIYWNDYYKRSIKASDLSVLMKYPATKWAFYLAVFTILVYLIFESKRKQRIIAEIPPLENTSVSFAETVGRLYYNKKDNQNLAEKMIQHFLEWVRTHYFIPTSRIDSQWVRQLTVKSGQPEAIVQYLAEMIKKIQAEKIDPDDEELIRLHKTIRQFYKSNKT